MQPATKNLTAYAGTTFAAAFRLRSAPGVYVDLAGSSAQFRVVQGATDVLVRSTPIVGGRMSLTLSPSDTLALHDVGGHLTYRWEFTDSQGVVSRVLQGAITVGVR